MTTEEKLLVLAKALIFLVYECSENEYITALHGDSDITREVSEAMNIVKSLKLEE